MTGNQKLIHYTFCKTNGVSRPVSKRRELIDTSLVAPLAYSSNGLIKKYTVDSRYLELEGTL